MRSHSHQSGDEQGAASENEEDDSGSHKRAGKRMAGTGSLPCAKLSITGAAKRLLRGLDLSTGRGDRALDNTVTIRGAVDL